MCTRYVLLKEHLREILARLGIPTDPNFVSRYNIAPASFIPAVRNPPKKATSASKGPITHEAVPLRWGLVPSWAQSDESGNQLVNARAETLADKPSFRDAFRTRRCIIPASGFYEWESRGRVKQPWLFRWRDERPFGFAGLWESWRAPDGVVLETCAVITTEPNELMRPVHHRMPVMLAQEQFGPWLDPQASPDDIAPLLRIAPPENLSALKVRRFVSNVRQEGPECLVPAGPDDDVEGDANQFSLGLE